MSMISLLLHESEAKLRMSANNKVIIRMYLGYFPKVNTNQCFFYNKHSNTMTSTGSVTYQSFLCTVAYIG